MKKINIHSITSVLENYLRKPHAVVLLIMFVFLLTMVLSFMRDATSDETGYLLETKIISAALSQKTWIGNYATGLHGFLFKIPPAVLFLIFKPSVSLATWFNIALGLMSLYIYYRFLKNNFGYRALALAGVFLLVTCFEFLRSMPTFLREIPSLFALLLFLESFYSKRSRIIQGLCLVLLLDAKEYVFFIVVCAHIMWMLINTLISTWENRTLLLKNLLDLFKSLLVIYIPSTLFIVLMLTTSLIPVNMFNAALFGLVEKGHEWSRNQFTTLPATTNSMSETSKTIQPPNIAASVSNYIFNDRNNFITVTFSDKLDPIINTLTQYTAKLLYPRTLSFISIPKILVFPAFFTSILCFLIWIKDKRKLYSFLPILLWTYLLAYLLRISHGRYLFPIAPVVILFFLIYVTKISKEPRKYYITLAFTSIMALLGLYFEESYLLEKAILNFAVILLLIIHPVVQKYRSVLSNYSASAIFLSIGFSTAASALMFTFTLGQASNYLKWGPNRECKQIIERLRDSKTLWINDNGCNLLLHFYRNDLSYEPEWNWDLKEAVPKKKLLRIYDNPNIYSFYWETPAKLRKQVETSKIDTVAIVVSTKKGYDFSMQYKLEELYNIDWLRSEGQMVLKNKSLYIFKVTD
ncbi:MAG: hypothetical protein ACD_22C00228G0001 [uncultured bacterium]|nr:MAG: hypothetical protein ACD_22C00228G0001 [uncultured bacterium]